jgi:ATP-dependent protease HslVU (ClpYQ) ATPase subunit
MNKIVKDYFDKFKMKMGKRTTKDTAIEWVEGANLNKKDEEELKKLVLNYLKENKMNTKNLIENIIKNEVMKQMIYEQVSQEDIKQSELRFSKFITELEKISKKYGFVLNVTGGVSYDVTNKSQIKNLTYSNDLSSRDITPKGEWSDGDKI